MQKQKDELFEILTGFPWMVDSKPTMESKIDREEPTEDEVPQPDTESQSDDAESDTDTESQSDDAESETDTEIQDEDAMLNTGLCALYFNEKWATKAVSHSSVRAGRFNDLRRTAFEPITKLLGESTSGQWTPALRTAAKQAFLKYFYQGKLDEGNISVLLKMCPYPAAQLATLVAIHDICSIGEIPLLSNQGKLLESLLRFFSHDSSYIFQEKLTSTLRYLAYRSDRNVSLISNAPGALAGLVESLLKDGHPTLQANAALVLQNIACGSYYDMGNIVKEKGAIEALVKSLSNDNNPSLQRRAAAAIANLACGQSKKMLDILEGNGALAGVVKSLLNDDNPILQQRAAGVFALLADGGSSPNFKMWEEEGVIAGLVGSLFKEDKPGLQENAAEALNKFLDWGKPGEREFFEIGSTSYRVKLKPHPIKLRPSKDTPEVVKCSFRKNPVLLNMLQAVSRNLPYDSNSANLTSNNDPGLQKIPTLVLWLQENSIKSIKLLQKMRQSKLKSLNSISKGEHSTSQEIDGAALEKLADQREENEYYIVGDMRLRWS